jgi:long-chain acyl-CoA synthetase
VNGFTVYPSEVEQAIRELNGVEAVAVVGVPDPDRGDRLVAFVVPPELSVEAVLEHCATRLAPYKRPAEVRPVDDLPRGVTGTVQRAALRRRAAEPAVTR